MDSDIAKLPATTFSGRRVTRRQLEDVKWTVENISHSSRNDLARTICEHLSWRTHEGDDKINACLAMIETLEARKEALHWLLTTEGEPGAGRPYGL